MRVLVRGAGWYGCHIAMALKTRGFAVDLVDSRDRMFGGASGSNPARLHLGYHYPRSAVTRATCNAHNAQFLKIYGDFTSPIETNHYAIAENDSLLDFGTYCQVLEGLPFDRLPGTGEQFGYRHLEGLIQTPERHIIIRMVREHFEEHLADVWRGAHAVEGGHDITIDCTFCAGETAGIGRYEPCVMGVLEGPTDRALTIMDGPFPSIYPWDEREHLSSITSASLTPLDKCTSYLNAWAVLELISHRHLMERCEMMLEQMARFWPDCRDLYRLVDCRIGIRAQPISAADSRYCQVNDAPNPWGTGRVLTVRPGKIDSILMAERVVVEACEFARMAAA